MTNKYLRLRLALISLIFLGMLSLGGAARSEEEKPLRICVGGMTTSKEGFVYYQKLLDYLEEKLGRKVKYIDKQDYAEINKMIGHNEIDAAFVSSGPYVEGHDTFGMKLLVAPQIRGEIVYYSYIIVNKDSPIKNFLGLKGKTFAFADPLSNTGSLVPTYMLAKMKQTPESFFKSFEYTGAHDKSIMAVAMSLVDGAAVDSLVWEYTNHEHPEYTSQTQIIEKSPPYATPPFVVRFDLDENTRKKLQKIFLNMHHDEKGQQILKAMLIDKFVEIDDKAYDSVREMKQWLAKQNLKKK